MYISAIYVYNMVCSGCEKRTVCNVNIFHLLLGFFSPNAPLRLPDIKMCCLLALSYICVWSSHLTSTDVKLQPSPLLPHGCCLCRRSADINPPFFCLLVRFPLSRGVWVDRLSLAALAPRKRGRERLVTWDEHTYLDKYAYTYIGYLELAIYPRIV
jgi:hypothetical protein